MSEKKYFSLKISHKLMLAGGLITLLTVGAFSLIVISQYHQMTTQIGHAANQLSETLKNSLKYDMLHNDRDHIHKIIGYVGEQDDIARVRLFNKEGVIIFSTDKSEISQRIDKRAEACFTCHAEDQPLTRLSMTDRSRIFENSRNDRMISVINPIYNEKACWQAACHAHHPQQAVLGVLDVTISLAQIDNQIRGNVTNIILMTIGTVIAVAFLIWFLVRLFIGRPVTQLLKATDYVATGDFSHPIEIRSSDELGVLAMAFNRMMERLANVQEQLYRSDKLASLGRLAAGVAHELNNPLTGVLTYSSFLLKHHQCDEKTREDLEVIVRETKRSREIVKGLLDFARQNTPRKTKVDINEVIQHSMSIMENQLNIQDIKTQLDLHDNLPETRADGNQLEQVFINLVVNAADAIGNGRGLITVTTDEIQKEGHQMLRITVADNGCGISSGDMKKIFDPFYSTKGQKGTGLGLAMVWGIIDKHDGNISVDSKVGEGTTFTILLPADKGGLIG